MNFVRILVSSFTSMVALFVMTKIMGNREMSQLSMFDYVSSIALGSIAGEMAVMSTDSIWEPLIAMAIYSVSAMFISYMTCKSIKLRRFFEGQPLILYQDGKIYDKNLLKAKLDLEEFMASCRLSGYYDLEEIHTIFLETNGTISILPKSKNRPATPEDLNLNPEQSMPMASIILDGKIMSNNLKTTGKNEQWLDKQLKSQGIKDISEVFLATYDFSKEKINVYKKLNKKMTDDIFE